MAVDVSSWKHAAAAKEEKKRKKNKERKKERKKERNQKENKADTRPSVANVGQGH